MEFLIILLFRYQQQYKKSEDIELTNEETWLDKKPELAYHFGEHLIDLRRTFKRCWENRIYRCFLQILCLLGKYDA